MAPFGMNSSANRPTPCTSLWRTVVRTISIKPFLINSYRGELKDAASLFDRKFVGHWVSRDQWADWSVSKLQTEKRRLARWVCAGYLGAWPLSRDASQ